MEFKQAYEALTKGAKIKRKHWIGYWCVEDNTIKMHCKNGDVIPFLETNDLFFTLDNIAADDWEVMDSTYEPILNIQTFTFGEAIRALKSGKKVCRQGWNGKSQYIELATNISYINAAGGIINSEHEAIGNKAIAFVGTSGIQMGWLASQADMLAEDWMLMQ